MADLPPPSVRTRTAMPTVARVDMFDVAVNDRTRWPLLRVTAADGVVGWGEVGTVDQPERTVAALGAVALAVIGRPLPEALDACRSAVDAASDAEAGATGLSARPRRLAASAACLALEDLAARATGVSLAPGDGAAGVAVPIYANINRRTRERAPDGFAASARDALDRGFRAVKLAPFDGMQPGAAGDPAQQALYRNGLDCIAAVRDAVGPGTRLMVDCHWRFDRAAAVCLVADVARWSPHWIEDVVPEGAGEAADLAHVTPRARDAGIRVAGGENKGSVPAFLPFLRDRLYDVILPDVRHAGGIAGCRAIARAAAAHGVAVAPHNPAGPLCHLASLHLCADVAGFDILEMQFDESPLFWTLVSDGSVPAVAGGESRLPAGVGLGGVPAPDMLGPVLAAFDPRSR
jgi:galactonate dehydratase